MKILGMECSDCSHENLKEEGGELVCQGWGLIFEEMLPEIKAQMIKPLIREFVEILFLPSIKSKRKLLEAFGEKVLTLFGKNQEREIKNRQFKAFKEFIKEY